MRFLIVESETDEERDARRASAGKSSGETYAATLEQLSPDCTVKLATPSDGHHQMMTVDELAGFDAVFLSGSPLHVYCETPETVRQTEFMRRVFASGTPSFGSCAGLQVACAAAGGTVRAMPHRDETGIARGITATEAGRSHPLLAGRPPAWDALAIHSDEVAELPGGATLLAGNHAARVQAAEIRVGDGVFWGVQYHPELAPGEVAAALRRQADSLVEDGTAGSLDEVEEQAALFDRLHRDPHDRSVLWRLGVTAEAALEDRRRVELANFIEHLVVPTRARRGRDEDRP
ncbi:type 1 glutamine amidotransferase [Sphingomonas rubra]|uniref:GMP synthase (Glutamine-hydrolysing) n=1 Tax=Sphingomonas rubra TaxID=634430 RepID=A0A1I5U4T0_9SPHN|nr:type 1 glutamine amidotransferase [Sphingomonas rubra]SFP90308.1 GMP synthase (glutamine-hydrolysing) [Sphingomonas rubra]